MIPHDLEVAIDNFLRVYRPRGIHCPLADLDPVDIQQLEDVVRLLLRSKFSPGLSGEFPVEVVVVDTYRHEPLEFKPVPVITTATNEVEAHKIVSMHTENWMIAQRKLNAAANTASNRTSKLRPSKKNPTKRRCLD